MHTPISKSGRQGLLAWLRARLRRQPHGAALAALAVPPAPGPPEAVAPPPAPEPPDEIDIAGWPALVAPFYD
ncbi:hypothetical protein [Massilia sp. CF038]|uniref:hypothetical protein n=1 Tax=Massilia sp. CF038 TaxID=1881045 RepID=UPI0009144A24|nr:hypothetical protein [Massilia sp. CF038]SHG67743.1 hypothetical protein SAMN05428948_1567 [Massilia sp. CF038]